MRGFSKDISEKQLKKSGFLLGKNSQFHSSERSPHAKRNLQSKMPTAYRVWRSDVF
ncbi:hypothetical protein CLOLEP_00768 [[Clostridium] leptum DSM 753]|uniref:Uncharacterized protein n=1 Tax=[Clostridium] leptum DSM 753 TaxID=428125 RepID=A7VQD8_9FIRM|nr:hypothetical protein CLOLEP_00768 [[Clostridium] leptum DSM 753]